MKKWKITRDIKLKNLDVLCLSKYLAQCKLKHKHKSVTHKNFKILF